VIGSAVAAGVLLKMLGPLVGPSVGL
jgi:hypothetical protein